MRYISKYPLKIIVVAEVPGYKGTFRHRIAMSEALKFSRLGFRCCRSPRDPSLRSFAEEKQTFPDGTTIKMNEFFSESEAQEN